MAWKDEGPVSAADDASFDAAPRDSARRAGLRHVDPDTLRGFKRVRRGAGFVYIDAHGRRFDCVRARDDEAFVKAVLTAAMPNRRRPSGRARSGRGRAS